MTATDHAPTQELLLPLRPEVHPVRRPDTLLSRIRVRALAVAVPLGAAIAYFHAVVAS